MSKQKVQRFEDTAANWTANNPILPKNWEGVESDTGYVKKGDGLTRWNDLAYSIPPASTSPTLTALVFDGSPQSVDFGTFYYQLDTPLGSAFYECYGKLGVGGGSGQYDWSAGYGGAHGMLRGFVNGNFTRAAVITGATNASPIVVTTSTNHGLSTGTVAIIRGVLGNTAANTEGTAITVISPTTFSINGSVGNGAYAGGGIAVGSLASFGNGIVEWTAEDVPYAGQWAHSATNVDVYGGRVVHYYDGVPVGCTDFDGTRICLNFPGSAAAGYMGGSDHSNFLGSLGQYRIFEENTPFSSTGINPTVSLAAFTPQMNFSGEQNGVKCNLLVDYTTPELVVTDKSQGYPEGRMHSGYRKGSGYGSTSALSTFPIPAYVVDTTIPNTIAGTQPVQPAGKVYVPAAVPLGALVFDSIQRKNCTYAFGGIGGMGSTEGGSLGPLTWHFSAFYAASAKPFGILNEQFVRLTDGSDDFAYVNVGQSNLDIRVSRKSASTLAGVSTGILFRYIDDLNYCFAVTGTRGASTRSNQTLFLGQCVAGVVTAWAGNETACPAEWEVLRVLTKSDGTYQVFCDATSLVSGTNATNAAGVGAGISVQGNPGYYGVGHSGAGLRMRYRNFTVFANP